MDEVDALIVASTRKWVADDFAAAINLRVVHDHGLDAPLLPDGFRAVWWTPGEHAARLLHAGIPFAPDAPPDNWLDQFPPEVTGRRIVTIPLMPLRSDPVAVSAPVFGKVAGSKTAKLPAGWHENLGAFVAAASAAVPAGTLVQVTSDVLDIVEEYRCFVVDGRAVSTARYMVDELPFGSEGFPAGDPRWNYRAAWFVEDVLKSYPDAGKGVLVIDAAVLRGGRMVVLEANPVWCSNPYDADLRAVAAAIIMAFTRTVRPWEPDAALRDYAARRPVLRLSTPLWL
jgi:hypothetical protein